MQQTIKLATIVLEDNQSCLKIIEVKILSNLTKCIDMKFNFVKIELSKELCYRKSAVVVVDLK